MMFMSLHHHKVGSTLFVSCFTLRSRRKDAHNHGKTAWSMLRGEGLLIHCAEVVVVFCVLKNKSRICQLFCSAYTLPAYYTSYFC